MINNPEFLAKELTAYLLPILPYLFRWIKLCGVEATKTLGEEVGKKIPGVVKEIWEKLWIKSERDPVSRIVLENASEKPESEIAQNGLEVQFAKLLEEESFRSEIAHLLVTAKNEMPKLNIIIDVNKIDGEVIGLNLLEQETSLKTDITIKEKVNTVSKGGKLIGAQIGKNKVNKHE